MPHLLRSLVAAGSLVALASGAAACGSSGGSDASASTTAAKASTTTSRDATTTSTEADASTSTSTAGGGSTTTSTPAVDPATGAIDCDALLLEYTEVFDPDDLTATVAFFRKYEPSMPDDVAAASERVAAAYEKAGDLGHMDMGSVDLTADAQTFSDWTNDGCPAG